MLLSIVVAMSQNRVIGVNNQLPWHLPDDLQHFKKLTLNKPIVMGRKTFESIGKPLLERHNIVVTRQTDYVANGVTVVNSLAAAMQAAELSSEVMIVGGAELYAQALPLCQRLYITQVECAIKGDTFFPIWKENEWIQVSRTEHARDDKHAYPFAFVTLERRELVQRS